MVNKAFNSGGQIPSGAAGVEIPTLIQIPSERKLIDARVGSLARLGASVACAWPLGRLAARLRFHSHRLLWSFPSLDLCHPSTIIVRPLTPVPHLRSSAVERSIRISSEPRSLLLRLAIVPLFEPGLPKTRSPLIG